jgi:glycogen synthase
MKILFLSNLYPPFNIGGYELICESVNRAMLARGHETMVLTSNHIVEGHVLPEEGDIRRTLRVHGFFGHPWLGIGKLKELEIHNNAELRRAVEDFEPDVIHVFNLGGISKSLTHTIERLGIPALYFISDHWLTQSLDADVWLNWWNRSGGANLASIARRTCELLGKRSGWDSIAPTAAVSEIRFRRLYFCSKFLRDKAVAWGRDVEHGEVIYNSVDIRRFDGLPAAEDAACERFLFVGRLTAEKGIITVLKAFKLLGKRFSGSLTVCGRGDDAYEKKLRAFVSENGLPVTFVSAGAGEMPDIYRRHDALIFASEWDEPFALTPLEAMASGLPVITTTTGGSAEFFQHARNSLTFVAGLEADLAHQILTLQRFPDFRSEIAAAGREEVREKFSEDRVMDLVENYIRETVETWNSPAAESERELAYA